jgi:hypothetical protein
MHKLGFKVPFPHYNSFLSNAVILGSFFGIFWGLFMYLSVWKAQNISPTAIILTILFAGSFFGLAMASYYKYGFKKYKLTPWNEINRAN